MLSYLSISNYSVIESVELELSEGLNILTGETGAGKSVIIGAISLLLGERFNKSMVRNPDEKVKIGGIFSGDFSHLPEDIKEEFEIDDEILIKRDIDTNGKNKVFINGQIATLKQLKSVTGDCIDIHGQHEHQKLLNAKLHLSYIDSRLKPEDLLQYQETYTTYQHTIKEITALKEELSQTLKEKDIFEFQLNEIDDMNIDLEKESELEQKAEYLSHIEKINQGLSAAAGYLSESDQNICDQLDNALRALNDISRFSEELGGVTRRLEEINYEIKDCREIIIDTLQGSELDTGELDQIMKRKYDLDKLIRKYGHSLEDVVNYRNTIYEKLENLLTNEDAICGLEKKTESLLKDLTIQMQTLNAERKTVGEHLSEQIVTSLKAVDLKNAQFHVNFDISQTPDKSAGAKAEFYISTNPGFKAAPLSTSASGGEISRVMLGLKEVFCDTDATHTMVFDEIDTGISGKTADKVGDKLYTLSRKKQLIVITHLPVVAAKGDKHYHIHKNVVNDQTVTQISILNDIERTETIAAMIAGKVSESSLANAAELLKS